METLQWARAHGCEWDAKECERAARENGHLEVAQWVRAQDVEEEDEEDAEDEEEEEEEEEEDEEKDEEEEKDEDAEEEEEGE